MRIEPGRDGPLIRLQQLAMLYRSRLQLTGACCEGASRLERQLRRHRL
jgi:hypothetical protein